MSRFTSVALAALVGSFFASCEPGLDGGHHENPLVDQTVNLGGNLTKVRIQIVARRAKHVGGKNPTVTGTFDLVVQVNQGPPQRSDLGKLIGSGSGSDLTFQDRPAKLTIQDLNHDGIKDANILHGADGYALISFDTSGHPYRLKFEGEPTGGYAKPENLQPVDVLSTNVFRLIPKGFRYQSPGLRLDEIWDPVAKVFVGDT